MVVGLYRAGITVREVTATEREGGREAAVWVVGVMFLGQPAPARLALAPVTCMATLPGSLC